MAITTTYSHAQNDLYNQYTTVEYVWRTPAIVDHIMTSRTISNELSMLERETLRRGCLTLESAAHEESFCVWHLVRFLSRNRILDLDNDDNQSDPGTSTGTDCSSSDTQKQASINRPFLDTHGRAAVRGAQVTNGVWVVLAKLARVIVCGPDHIPVDQLEFRNPPYYKRLRELQASFNEEKANLDRYCAENKTVQLFPEGYPSSQKLLKDIQRGAEMCSVHLNKTLNLRGLNGVDMTVWKTCTKLLETTLDMSWDAGGFLDLVSWMIFGKGSKQALPKPLARSATVPQRTIPLVSKMPKMNTMPKKRRESVPPPNILSKATTTTQITAPDSPTSIGEQTMYSGAFSRNGSVSAAQEISMAIGSKFQEDLPAETFPAETEFIASSPPAAVPILTSHEQLAMDVSAVPVPQKVVIIPPGMLTENKSRLRYIFSRKKK